MQSSVAELLLAQAAGFLALLLLVSALHKWLGLERAAQAVGSLCRVRGSAARSVALVASVAEVSAGVLLILPAMREVGAALAALIFSGYLALLVRALLEGRRDIDCGCTLGRVRRPLGAFEVARNGVLAALALLIFVASAGAAAPLAPSQLLGSLAFLALYAALDQVAGLAPLRKGTVL
jgi:uncharacterized membrane protein YphA (DoxX/SURF4 family)